MNKKAGIILAAALLAAGVTGCSSKQEETKAAETTAAETSVSETQGKTEESNGKGYKTGLAVITALDSSKDAADSDGNAQVDSVVAAVVLDADGKIVNCVIDTAESKMVFSNEGKVVSPLDTEFSTKKELKDEYGMKAASGIKKEWYEQAEAMEAYVIGKTPEEVAGIAVDEKTAPVEEDLTASVTIKIGDYTDAIVKAAANAVEMSAGEGDKLGLGIVTNMQESKDASGGNDGVCQAYSTYAAVTIDSDGKITSNVIDASQGNINFDADGQITSDLNENVETKKWLGDKYGMKAASGIGKEWYEQAEAFEKYTIGKTVQEVNQIAVDESAKTTEEDLAASVTISIGDFQSVIEKAVNTAK